jgi:D-alanyl-D-alanine carboxypeptidase (penicillin-binding protein 5/6)
MMWRRRGGVVLGAMVLSAGVASGPLLAAPASAALPAKKYRPPVCATAVAYSSGITTSTPVPLPAPASDAGGTRLAQPGLQVQLKPGTAAPPRLKASAWIVADLTTGDVIAACNAHVPLAPASTLKVLTALALHPRLDPRIRYVARPQDAAIDGTKVGLDPGSVYTVDNLWHGLLMGSGNDAANALATLAGGTPKAAALMTSTARSLGARDTVVANTSGLDAPGQVSSVYDLAIFGRALLRDPGLAGIVRTTTYAFPSAGHATRKGARKTYQIQNHNRLLLNYQGTTGVKNGYTSTAGASLVASATRGGHSYVVAMLRSDVNVWGIGADLLDWAFAQHGGVEPVGRLDATPAPAAAASAPTSAGQTPLPTSSSRNRYAPVPAAVPPVVGGPVRATLQAMPEGQRTGLLLAVLALALVGGAMVRRLALARSAPRSRSSGTRAKARTPTKRSPTTGSRPTPKRTTTPARRPAPRRR